MKQTTVFPFIFHHFLVFRPCHSLKKPPGDFGRSTLVELHQRQKMVIMGAYYQSTAVSMVPLMGDI